jgi:hypothetical protein
MKRLGFYEKGFLVAPLLPLPALTARDISGGGIGGGGGGEAGITWTLRPLMRFNSFLDDVVYGNGLFVAVGCSGTALTSPDGVDWTQRTSEGNDLFGVTYGDLFLAVDDLFGVTFRKGLFVAVGWCGTILTSPDGVDWTEQTSPTRNDLFGVTYGKGTFVAVGWNGTILTSPDGVNWTRRTSGTSNNLSRVAYGNGTFVVVGDFGTILTSP